MSKRISIVVPCLNEGGNILAFSKEIKRVFETLPGYSYEIIFINDGSKDHTVDEISKLVQKQENIRLIDLSRNFGKEIALTAGINFAKGDAVIPMDADMQDPPNLIPTFIDYWEKGYDVVYGVRTSRENEPLLKKLTAYLFYRVINTMSEVSIPKDTGDFRLMDKKVVDALGSLPEHHRFMKGIFSWVGFNQIGVPYIRKPRSSGKTKFNFPKLFGLAIDGITAFSVRPLKIASIAGVLISVASFVYGIYIVLISLLQGNDVPGYTSLISIVLFLGGVQLLSIGVLGEYIGRIYGESKRRPLYLIKKTEGF